MAIKQKELYNKQHVLNKCVGFDYDLVPMDEKRKPITLRFSLYGDDAKGNPVWRVQWHKLESTGFDDVRTLGYSLCYAMPMGSMPLVMVCAYGLRMLAGAFAETIQDMSAHEYMCYELTKDM